MSENVIFNGKMNSHDNHGKLDMDVKIVLLGNCRIVAYISDEHGNTREAAIEIDGENSDRLILMTHGPYNPNDLENTYSEDPTFIAKVGSDRAYAYNNTTGQTGTVGSAYVKVSEQGLEFTDTMEFPEPSIQISPSR
jgi:hypothetical protein